MRIRRIRVKREAAAKRVCTLKKREKSRKQSGKVFKPPLKKSPGFLMNILSNPNLGFNVVVILMTFLSDNGQMERKIGGVSDTVEKIRDIADVLNHTMKSVRVAAETPRKIRQLLE